MAAATVGAGLGALCGEALERAGVPGAAIGLLQGGETWTASFGLLEAGGRRRVQPGSTFRIASLTKPFTALLALDLAREGLLELAEEVPAAPAPGVTVQHLLSHLGGFEGECGDLSRFGSGDDALARLASDLSGLRQVVPAGTLWSYCNAGFWLLGRLVEERTGRSYEQALAERVLRPLGLAHTSFGPPDAHGHEQGTSLPDAYPRARRASGGLVADVGDLLLLARHLLDAAQPATLREPLARTPSGWYGLGLALERAGALELWGHDGDYGGFESRLRFEPSRGFAFVGLANARGGGRALDEILDAALELALGSVRPDPPTVPVARGELARLAGRYVQPEVELDVCPSGTGLELAVTTIDRDTLERVDEHPARARAVGPRLFEILDGARRGDRFDFHPAAGVARFARFASRLAERSE